MEKKNFPIGYLNVDREGNLTVRPAVASPWNAENPDEGGLHVDFGGDGTNLPPDKPYQTVLPELEKYILESVERNRQRMSLTVKRLRI